MSYAWWIDFPDWAGPGKRIALTLPDGRFEVTVKGHSAGPLRGPPTIYVRKDGNRELLPIGRDYFERVANPEPVG